MPAKTKIGTIKPASARFRDQDDLLRETLRRLRQISPQTARDIEGITDISEQSKLLLSIAQIINFDESKSTTFGMVYSKYVNDVLEGRVKREKYNERINKKTEDAKSFLLRVYSVELAFGNLTLSDLRDQDKQLWAGLRNWANHGNHNLDAIIPRGRTKPGAPRKYGQDIDESKLDPNDPVEALALDSLRQRRRARERAADSYSRRKNLQPK